jgi:hypothetical protein
MNNKVVKVEQKAGDDSSSSTSSIVISQHTYFLIEADS